MNFSVEGANLQMPGEASPLVKVAHAALDALPDGKLWTVDRVAVAIGRSHVRAQTIVAKGGFEAHRVKHGNRYLYGSKRTVQLWQKSQAKPASAKS